MPKNNTSGKPSRGFFKRLWPFGSRARTEKLPREAREPNPKLQSAITMAGHIVTGALVVTILGASVLAHRPLERYVAGIRAQPPKVQFEWPSARDPRTGKTEVWLPGAVQVELMQIASATLTPDPFDREALDRVRARLESTGWLKGITMLRREPGGVVRIAGDWRAPAAVVKQGRDVFLVARGGELLQLPKNTPLKPGALFTVHNPFADPPTDPRTGKLIYGKAWPGGDVQAAINLLANLHDIPGSSQIAGVDLAGYMKSGKLVIVTDHDTRIVWGSAIDETVPGEVKPEVKKARLIEFVKTNGRIDAGQRRIEVYSQRPFVDETAAATDALEGGA